MTNNDVCALQYKRWGVHIEKNVGFVYGKQIGTMRMMAIKTYGNTWKIHGSSFRSLRVLRALVVVSA